MNHRTHRKVMVVDETVVFTGGVGIADVWLGNASNENEWRDTHFRISGPVVDGLRGAFLDNWIEEVPTLYEDDVDRFPDHDAAGDVTAMCVRGSSERGWSDIATLFRVLVQIAQRRLRITTAYFVPDDDLIGRLTGAAQRGVAVEILIPGPHADKRFVQVAAEASYEPLLKAGVRIWNFQPSMLHAKIATVDGVVASIGSANLNSRSMALDDETNVVAMDPALVRTLDAHFDEDLTRSVEIDLDLWEHRSPLEAALEKTTAPLRKLF
jgi:cardiolipin synthase